MQPLDPGFPDHQHLAGLHARLAVGRHHVGLHDHHLTGAERLRRHRAGGPVGAAEHRRQIAAAIAVQQIVDDGEAGLLDDAGRLDHLRRRGAGLEHGGDGVEG